MTFVYFDLDRTLINHDRAERLAVQEFHTKFQDQLDRSVDEFLERWRRVADEYWKEYHKGTIGYREQKRERVRTLLDEDASGLPDDEADDILDWYLSHYKRSCELFHDAKSCLENLVDRVDLGILTNGGESLQHDKLERTDIIDYFDPIVCSDEVGHAKPNEQIFTDACNRADRSPQDVIYIGDSIELDVDPANELGMTGVWLNRNKRSADSLPSHHFQSLEDFPGFVLENARVQS